MVYNNHTNITWCRCERNRMWRRQEFGEVGEERWVIGSMDEEEGKRGVVVMENWMNNVIWQGCVKEDKGFMEGYLGENFEQEEVEG